MHQVVARSPLRQDERNKKRVLIISTYKTPCGIAEFTETVESLLGDDYEIEIAVLDQFLLKSTEKHLDKAGDELIDAIVQSARSADVVNLQWEPGRLGRTQSQILRRFKRILRANPNLVVTVHTVLPLGPKISTIRVLQELRRGGVIPAVKYLVGTLRDPGRKTYRLLAKAGRNAKFQLIVHSKRDRRFFSDGIGIRNVHDHPLSNIRKGWEGKLEESARGIRTELEARHGKRIFVGAFGFFGEYKGVSTAIEALRYLRDDYMLLLYGSVHPDAIKEWELKNHYLEKIMQIINPPKVAGAPSKLTLVDRVQFLGAPDAFGFASAMKACDVNVFPYVEVGQSASGPASLSIELGKRTVVSNNAMFDELERYFPGRTEKADIGNYIQLAQAIMRAITKPEPGTQGLAYNSRSMTDLYSRAFELASNRDCAASRQAQERGPLKHHGER